METTFEHKPVLVDEVLQLLAPQPGGTYCDATVGGGGHAREILHHSSPDGRLVGIDRDPQAVAAAQTRLAPFGDRVSIFHGEFAQLDSLLARADVGKLDGLLVDLGVSSHQLDVAERGFSFMRAGPLDMRMDPTDGESAATLLHRVSEDELTDLIHRFGGERFARKIARSIKNLEASGQLNTTSDLAVAIKKVLGSRKRGGVDPATRTFQAVRIAVNGELDQIATLLELLPEPLAIGGTAVVISFHSAEDRLVKRRFAELVDPCICPPGMPVCTCPPPRAAYVSRRSVRATAAEVNANPRARSARARAIRRIR